MDDEDGGPWAAAGWGENDPMQGGAVGGGGVKLGRFAIGVRGPGKESGADKGKKERGASAQEDGVHASNYGNYSSARASPREICG